MSDTTVDDNSMPFPRSAELEGKAMSIGSRPFIFGNREVDGVNVQAFVAVVICIIVAVVGLLKFGISPFERDLVYTEFPALVKVQSGDELILLLKENGLWDLNDKKDVPPIVFTSFPAKLDEISLTEKKRIFFHTLLPAALVATAEVDKEKQVLRSILAKFPGGYNDLEFSVDYAVWGRGLTLDEIEFMIMLTRKYRTTKATRLLKRVDTVPLSLILAQAAIESSWGTSRFAREGNNLFGIWTWGEKGIVPHGRDEGLSHKVAIYDSILDSVRAYIVMLNRLPSYRSFREIRSRSNNSLRLAEGLLFYSERREKYVSEVQRVIRNNRLYDYDDFSLNKAPIHRRLLNAFRNPDDNDNGSA